ncbi:MAG: DUF502 domain-containing protein [Gammaproteobacteria bacterium]|jgi:uncharacterized membrane protein|nr:DUF502 domain-containing protein [Gammaproteobacteria bacterium]MDH5172975.1 DUF502 domain-containing protein [Gammaproteobacteria bacterium]
MFRFLKTTILGGVLFLVPIVIFLAVIGKALQLTHALAAPLARLLPVATVAGMAVVELVALGILVLVCFAAGLAARTARARKLVQSLEANVLDKIPAYALMKTKTGSILAPEDTQNMQAVLVRFDDSWQVGFEVEKIGDGKSLLFLPGSPDPWSGSVCAVTTDRLQPLNLNIKEVGVLMKRLGRGSTGALGDPLRDNQAR